LLESVAEEASDDASDDASDEASDETLDIVSDNVSDNVLDNVPDNDVPDNDVPDNDVPENVLDNVNVSDNDLLANFFVSLFAFLELCLLPLPPFCDASFSFSLAISLSSLNLLCSFCRSIAIESSESANSELCFPPPDRLLADSGR
jgi:hypothetical protein